MKKKSGLAAMVAAGLAVVFFWRKKKTPAA